MVDYKRLFVDDPGSISTFLLLFFAGVSNGASSIIYRDWGLTANGSYLLTIAG